MGRCDRCGTEGVGSGVCPSCAAHISWMNNMNGLVEHARQINLMLDQMIWSDDGCCGCSVHRRRVVALVYVLICIGIGIAFLAMGKTEMFVAGLGGAALFLSVAVLCPNGFCGRYARDKKWGRLRAKDISYYRHTKCRFDSAAVAMYDADCNLLSSPFSPLMAGGSGTNSGAVGHSADANSDESKNLRAVHEYVQTYNNFANLTSEEVRSFVDRTYDDAYHSVAVDKKERGKADLVAVFEAARGAKYTLQNIIIFEAGPQHVAYGYDFITPQSKAPYSVNAFVKFSQPGVMLSLTAIPRSKK